MMQIRKWTAGAAIAAMATLSACGSNATADNNMATDMNGMGADYGTMNDANMMGGTTDMNSVDMNATDMNSSDMNSATDMNAASTNNAL